MNKFAVRGLTLSLHSCAIARTADSVAPLESSQACEPEEPELALSLYSSRRKQELAEPQLRDDRRLEASPLFWDDRDQRAVYFVYWEDRTEAETADLLA